MDVLARMPVTLAGLADGRLSWSQTVAIVKAAKHLNRDQREQLDGLIGDRLDEFAAYEPDELVDRVWDQVDILNPQRLEREEAITEADEFVALMPRLFGGGTFYGQYGTENFALLAEALDAGNPPPAAADLDDVDPTTTMRGCSGGKPGSSSISGGCAPTGSPRSCGTIWPAPPPTGNGSRHGRRRT